MSLYNILNNHYWAIEQRFFDRACPIVLDLILSGKDLSHFSLVSSEKKKLAAYEVQGGAQVNGESVNKSKIAMIRVIGALTKRGDLSSYGMQHYAALLNKADNDPEVATIVMEVDSPGGTVDGTEDFALAVKNTKKPVVIWADQILASGAYFFASQANHIVSNGKNPTVIGSIGAFNVYENHKQLIKDKIGEVKIIRAPQSRDKARPNSIEELTEDQEVDIKSTLKGIVDGFVGYVKAGRKGKLNTEEENIFTGKVYNQQDALKYGLIDQIGSLGDAINKAFELANTKNTGEQEEMEEDEPDEGVTVNASASNTVSTSQSFIQESNFQSKSTNKMKWKKNFKAALSALGFGDNVSEEDLPEIREEHIETLNQRIEETQAENSRLSSDLATITQERDNLITERDNLQSRIEELGEQPGAMPSTPPSDGDRIEGSRAKQEEEALNNMPHNKHADELL